MRHNSKDTGIRIRGYDPKIDGDMTGYLRYLESVKEEQKIRDVQAQALEADKSLSELEESSLPKKQEFTEVITYPKTSKYNSVEVGVLWLHNNRDGTAFYEGPIEIDGNKIRIRVAPNLKYEPGSNRPMKRVYLRKANGPSDYKN